jgi:hypothetical protein
MGRAEEIAMIDADTCSSSFDRLPPGSLDPDPEDLDRLAASLHHLTFFDRELSADEGSDHVAIEPMDAHKQCLSSAILTTGG